MLVLTLAYLLSFSPLQANELDSLGCQTPDAIAAEINKNLKGDEARELLKKFYANVTAADTAQFVKALDVADAKAEEIQKKQKDPENPTPAEEAALEAVLEQYYKDITTTMQQVSARMGRKPIDPSKIPTDQLIVALTPRTDDFDPNYPVQSLVFAPNPSNKPLVQDRVVSLAVIRTADAKDAKKTVDYVMIELENTESLGKNPDGSDFKPEIITAFLNRQDVSNAGLGAEIKSYSEFKSEELCKK